MVYVIRNVSKKRFWLNIYRKKGSHREVHPYAKQKLCSTAVMDELHLMNFKKAVWRAQWWKIILLWKRTLPVYPDCLLHAFKKNQPVLGSLVSFLFWVQHKPSWISFQLEKNTEALLYLCPSLRNLERATPCSGVIGPHREHSTGESHLPFNAPLRNLLFEWEKLSDEAHSKKLLPFLGRNDKGCISKSKERQKLWLINQCEIEHSD